MTSYRTHLLGVEITTTQASPLSNRTNYHLGCFSTTGGRKFGQSRSVGLCRHHDHCFYDDDVDDANDDDDDDNDDDNDDDDTYT